MSKLKNRIGEKYVTLQGYTIEIIEYYSRLECTIRFDDGVVLNKLRYPHVVNGYVKNPNHKSVCGVGYLGVGKYKRHENKKPTIQYSKWKQMIERCYSKGHLLRYPTYSTATVYEEWHNFQVFAEWFENNYDSKVMQGWELDKDILIKNNKLYSPEKCVIIPKEINYILLKSDSIRGLYPIGVSKSRNKFTAHLTKNNGSFYLGTYKTAEEAFQAYKTAKEEYIKELADKWRARITEPTYKAMYNYEVEITD